MNGPTNVGVLHPGSMGAAIAAQAARDGAEVLWCAAGRSSATRQRAEAAGLTSVRTLRELCDRSALIISLCPPAHAQELAAQVAAEDFVGTYVECNAIAPDAVAGIHEAHFGGSGFVDGAVVGSPPSRAKTPRLYASGSDESVRQLAALFAGTAVDVRPLAGGVGQASALKLAYSSYQKTSRVLAAVAYALAQDHQVEDELLDIAGLRTTNYLEETSYIPKTAARSWRWGPEMLEAADALSSAGLPPELVEAAAAVMSRWEPDKDSPPELSEALRHLHADGRSEAGSNAEQRSPRVDPAQPQERGVPTALFDLDNTLIDRDQAVRGWASAFARAHGLAPGTERHLAGKLRARATRQSFEQLRHELALDAPAAQLWAEYVDTIATLAARTRGRSPGWNNCEPPGGRSAF
ncbi:DUF1932 domain-containing protein [Streptomyces sp. AA1529]|uniref:DUF1932 domain-containing protein n=1 Tax=Streptomyces sp. AA1529 TaxID=1203257 RepID=UPI0002ECDD23